MRLPASFVALIACASALPAIAAAAPSKPDPDPPERLLVTAREFSLSLSRTKLSPGDAIVELYDFGEDPHDLRIQRVGGPTVFAIPEVLPGDTGRLELRLRKRSRYRLWCSLADHVERGMYASLRTSRR
jgi:hypothetical protein